jgi:hypothetical protein
MSGRDPFSELAFIFADFLEALSCAAESLAHARVHALHVPVDLRDDLVPVLFSIL